MAHHSFETGTARIGGDSVCGFYPTPQGPMHPFSWRKANDFVIYHPPTEEDFPMTEALFALKSDPSTMGRVIGTNSEGKKVFEVRPTNELRIIDAADLEEVRPHTVLIAGNHYEAPKDLFAKGDVLLTTSGDVHIVEAIDTKSRSTNPLPKGLRRLLTEPRAL